VVCINLHTCCNAKLQHYVRLKAKGWLSQAEVRQDPDSQAKKILRQNYPHRCFLDAEKLKSGDEVLPDLSLPAEPDELMVKLVRPQFEFASMGSQ
jgi:hypothetical protein